MLIGAHTIIYSTKPDADRDFLRHVLELTHVDVGHGWLIFGLPPSEVAVHPADANAGAQALYLMVDDIAAFVAEMNAHALACDPVQCQRWGMVTQITLPGGGTLGVYQPRHARPARMSGLKPGSSRKTAPKRTPARAGKTRAVKTRTVKKRAR